MWPKPTLNGKRNGSYKKIKIYNSGVSAMNKINILLTLFFIFLPGPIFAQSDVVSIHVDATKPGKLLKHVWQYYGYDECNYTTTPNCIKLMKTVAQINPEPVYLRQHFLLNSGDGKAALKWGSTNVYTENDYGEPLYNWRIMDEIFDTIISTGCHPLVEIGLMPKDLSVRPDPYRPPKPLGPNEGIGVFFPPKDYEKWAELIHQWARHVKDRYKNVEQTWLWELWNEPDIFYWQGSYEEYVKLFEYTERALHEVMPDAILGGPHVAGVGKFMQKFLTHCAREKNSLTGKKGTRLDYIGFHAKGGTAFKDGHVEMSMLGQLRKHQRGFALVASFSEFKNTPIIIGEADPDGLAALPASQSPSRGYRNVPAYGAYVAAMMKYTLDLAEREDVNLKAVLTWAFMFDDQPYFEGYRTLATNGIHKPVLNAFKMLGQLKGNELSLTSDGSVGLDEILKASIRAEPDINGMAVSGDQRIKIIIWNYHDFLIPAKSALIQLEVKFPADFGTKAQVVHYRIDNTHSNAYTKWRELGSPQNPDPETLAKLRTAMQLEMLEAERLINITDSKATLNFDLPRFGLSLIILEKPNL
jgi:xylan 1,4-beta-xylosidase